MIECFEIIDTMADVVVVYGCCYFFKCINIYMLY